MQHSQPFRTGFSPKPNNPGPELVPAAPPVVLGFGGRQDRANLCRITEALWLSGLNPTYVINRSSHVRAGSGQPHGWKDFNPCG